MASGIGRRKGYLLLPCGEGSIFLTATATTGVITAPAVTATVTAASTAATRQLTTLGRVAA